MYTCWELWPAEMSLIKIIASVLADIVEIVADTGDLGNQVGSRASQR